MATSGGVLLLSADEQRKLQRDKAELTRRNRILQERLKSEKAKLEADRDTELRRVVRIEREVSQAQLEEARSDAARRADEDRRTIEELKTNLDQEKLARQQVDSDKDQLREELERLQGGDTSEDVRVRTLQEKLKTLRKDMDGVKAALHMYTTWANEFIHDHVRNIPALKLPASVTRPFADYLNYDKLDCGSDFAYETCWRGGSIGIDTINGNRATKHCPQGLVLGRLEHSPGFPLLPGQPGTIIVHDTQVDTLYDEILDLGVLWPTTKRPQCRGELRWRYLGRYTAESEWKALPKEDWANLPRAVRQTWCRFLKNPAEERRRLGSNWYDWSIAARISLRKAALPHSDPAYVKQIAREICDYTWAKARGCHGSELPSLSFPYQLTHQDIDDALCKGEEVLYIRTLRPIGFDSRLFQELRELERRPDLDLDWE